MIAKLINGLVSACPKLGRDGKGKLHTNLPKYYEKHLDVAAKDNYYPVKYTEKPEGNYIPTWQLIDGEITQVWIPYTPEPEPMDVDVVKMRSDVDYIAMMTDVDLDGGVL